MRSVVRTFSQKIRAAVHFKMISDSRLGFGVIIEHAIFGGAGRGDRRRRVVLVDVHVVRV